MNWSAPYQAKRSQYWPEFENFFSALPPPLFQQGVQLKNNLATFFAAGGQFSDLLCRERDHPLLYWHWWLLDDLDCPDTPTRVELEQRLFLAMAFVFAAVYTRESILNPATNIDASFTSLDHALARQSDFHLGQLFPAASPFWSHYHACWDEYAAALLTIADRRSLTATQSVQSSVTKEYAGSNLQYPQGTLSSISNLQSLFPHLAFSKISPAAVIAFAGRDEIWPQLESLLNHLNAVLQLLREIANLRQDLTQRRFTYPILKTLELAQLDPHQSLPVERILGALVLTGVVPTLCQEVLGWLAEGRSLAQSLKLPTFGAYVGVLETWLGEVHDLFSLRPKTKSVQSPQPQISLFVPAVDTLSKVIEMAEGYLLADLTFRGSWEIQRRGLFGVSEMVGQAFPMGLIAEILARYGHDMSGPINDIFQTLQVTGFRYYNHPHLPPDTDDLGLLLRLYPHSHQPELHWTMLETPLRWLQENITETGQIPVWLTRFDTADKMDIPFVALWGNYCAAVEANVLLGLLAFDTAIYRPLIESSARQWSQGWQKRGLGATHHYVPLYALGNALELVAQLKTLDFLDDLPQLSQTLTDHLSLEARRAYLTPQDAAFLTLASLSPAWPESSPSLFNREWVTWLCKSQRYDGSWDAEPLYGTPTRGEFAAWYSSGTVTTAFCYHALKTFSAKQA